MSKIPQKTVVENFRIESRDEIYPRIFIDAVIVIAERGRIETINTAEIREKVVDAIRLAIGLKDEASDG